MQRILVTGATGNVGFEVIKSLCKLNAKIEIVAGVRNMEQDKQKLLPYKLSLKKFDFLDSTSYSAALESCQILFLLRPPQISDTEKYFKPLIYSAKRSGIKHIVFLSVQGVEKSSIIPHHKIEKLIVESEISYTFLRPAYFMQNFTTTLHEDLVAKKLIFLPAGNARFTLVDVRDVGEVAARVIVDIDKHFNKSYELTCAEKLTFTQMAQKLSSALGIPIKYKSANLLHFYLTKRKDKVSPMFILIMIMLHYLPRFQKEPSVTYWVENITGNPPTTFEKFVADNKAIL
jgi:uncharacterized protein YbjT (DUF2867 family)